MFVAMKVEHTNEDKALFQKWLCLNKPYNFGLQFMYVVTMKHWLCKAILFQWHKLESLQKSLH
jgi:hypothetical protein